MKKNIIGGLLASLFLLNAASAGVLVTGKAITFLETDFVDGTAKKSWSVNGSDAAYPDTELWSYNQAAISNGYWLTISSSAATASQAVWKFVVPESLGITGFSWGVKQLILNGAQAPGGDDSFAWQYSVDGSTWTTFFERSNRAEGEATITLNNQVLSETISGTAIHELYIRAVGIEGPIASDSNYWAVISKTLTGGGTDPNSFIQLNVTSTIPEPSTAATVIGAAAAMVAMYRRTPHTRVR